MDYPYIKYPTSYPIKISFKIWMHALEAFTLSDATVLHGSERIASMLTWNDFGQDMKMRLWADGYSKMKEDVAFRLEQAQTVGLGFAIPPGSPMLSVLSVKTK